MMEMKEPCTLTRSAFLLGFRTTSTDQHLNRSLTSTAMSSSVSSASSASSVPFPVQIGYVECYGVLYSPGERFKPGKRSWNDGLLTYYTFNKKLVLRSDRGILIEEAFGSPPPFLSSVARNSQQPIKEEGIRSASFPVGIAFQISESYTIEIEQVKFIHSQKIDIATLRKNAHSQRNTRIKSKYLKDVPDIMAEELEPSQHNDITIKSVSKSNKQTTPISRKRKAGPISPLDFNTPPFRKHIESTPTKTTLKDSPWMCIGTDKKGCRVSGLSRKSKQS